MRKQNDEELGAFPRIVIWISDSIWSILVVSFLFTLFSLPVITIYASFGAAVRCFILQRRGEHEHMLKSFYTFFIKDFLPNSAVGIFCTLMMIASAYSGGYYGFITEGSAIHYLTISLCEIKKQ